MDTIGRRSGYLQKQGGNIKSWKRRWFILHLDVDSGDDDLTRSFSPGQLLEMRRFALRSAVLRYYKGADGSLHEPLGSINMAECVVIEDAEVALKRPNSFRLVTPTRTYYLVADTRREADEWSASLTRTVQLLRAGRTGAASNVDASHSFSGTLSTPVELAASSRMSIPAGPTSERDASDAEDSADDVSESVRGSVSAQSPPNDGAHMDGGETPLHAQHASIPASARSSTALPRDILSSMGSVGSPLFAAQAGIRMSLQRGMEPLSLSPALSGTSSPGRPASLSLPAPPAVLGATGTDDVRGFLLKKKEGKNWKRRWCVLSGRSLSYFKAEVSEVAQGAIEIEAGTTVADADADTRKPNSFKISTGGTTYYFVAETIHDKDLWMNGLQIVARLAASVAELVALSVPAGLAQADAAIGTLSVEQCVVRGQGVESGVVGVESSFIIEARDGAGNLRCGRSDPFVVKINGPFDAPRPEARIKNGCDGTYRVTYTCEAEGDYVVAITVDGNHVADSPYYAPHDDAGAAGDRRSGSTSSSGSVMSATAGYGTAPRRPPLERQSVNARQLHAQHQRDNSASIQRAFLDYLAAP